MKKAVIRFLETLVTLAILLVIVQTFLDDYAVLAGWEWRVRRILIFTALGFDIFFTVEFLSRYISSAVKGRSYRYMLHERGWIDLVASIPLLLFNSGPAALSALAAGGSFFFGIGGSLNILKIVKAIRMARILRMLRTLKIFKQLKFAESGTAQRHISKVTTMVISTVVIALFLYPFILSATGLRTYRERTMEEETLTAWTFYNQTLALIDGNGTGRRESFSSGDLVDPDSGNLRTLSALQAGKVKAIEDFSSLRPGLLMVKHDKATLFSRYDNPYYSSFFGPGDYFTVVVQGYTFFFDARPISESEAKESLLFLLIILGILFIFLFYYGPHFAYTITDPVHIMYNGMKDSSYNLEVEIPEHLREDDIFKLVEEYNTVFLPMKDRAGGKKKSSGGLSMESLKDLLEGDFD